MATTCRSLLALAALPALTACSVISPMPLWELTKAAGMAAHAALPYSSGQASNTVQHPHRAFEALCIEFNPSTPVHDIVPALQIELRKHRVDSRVYEANAALDSCHVWLRYSASTGWDIPPFGGAYRAYVRSASLSLHDADGRVLSSSAYELDAERLGRGKWATTQQKLAPVVTALLTGFQG